MGIVLAFFGALILAVILVAVAGYVVILATFAAQMLAYLGMVVASGWHAGWRGETATPSLPPWPWRWP